MTLPVAFLIFVGFMLGFFSLRERSYLRFCILALWSSVFFALAFGMLTVTC